MDEPQTPEDEEDILQFLYREAVGALMDDNETSTTRNIWCMGNRRLASGAVVILAKGCLGVGAWLKVNTRALGRGAL